MSKYYQYPCGCSFPVRGELKGYEQPLLYFGYDDINMKCPKVWSLFEVGTLAGVFQLESNLGIRYSKELKPENIEHLAALVSILRPGTLQSKDENGKNLTQKYCDRKNGKEEIIIEPAALIPILAPTYGVMCFQEQQTLIAKELCGFNLSEADTLRKGVGKKDAKLLFSLQERFIDGARRVGKITETEAITIFDWIKAAARYSFNKSHGVLYAIRAYKEAYLKLHFPLQFYTSKLKSPRSSKTKDDEVNLIYEMKKWNIPIKLPDLRHLRAEYYNDGESIYFGLCNIKGFGESNYEKLREFLEHSPDQDQILSVFFEFVIHCARYLTPSIVENLILSGSVDFFRLSRTHMLEEYKLVADLTNPQKELLWKWVDANNSGVFN